MSAPTLGNFEAFLRAPRSVLAPEPDPEPSPHAQVQPRRRWPVALGLIAVLGLFAARGALVARSDAITTDEATHLTHCLHFWMTGDDLGMWELGAPRLPHVLYAGVSYLALKRAGMLPSETGAALEPALKRLVLSDAPQVLLPARGVALAIGMGLIGLVAWGVARTRGPVTGLIAAGLVAMVPEVLAHSAIAGSDVPFAAAALLAIVLLARYVERPSRGRWWAVALAIGLAWAIRHTALLLIALAVGAHAWCALRRPRPRGLGPIVDRLFDSVLASVGLAMVAYLVLWAGDGFGTIRLGDAALRTTNRNIPQRIGPIDISVLPLPTSALSIVKQVSHQSRGHEAFFLGARGERGWPLYFPVAFLLKTPVGLILLMVLAAATVRPRGAWEVLCLAFLALLWAALIRSKVNIGLRYALLTYPLVAPFLARRFEPRALRDRLWGPVTVAALGWFVAASAWSHPRYLSYFNELGGGPRMGWVYLADSNIDWGQDFDRLAATLKRLGITDVTLDTTFDRPLAAPGLCAIVNPHREFQVPANTPPNRRLYDAEGGSIPVYTRYFAVSVSRLHGLYCENDLSWLRTRRLVARVGDSVFLFDLDEPAAGPLFE
jgi:hypothetical protein